MKKITFLIVLAFLIINPIINNGQTAYVPNFSDSNPTLSVVDLGTQTIIETISIGDTPGTMAINSDESKLYLANSNNGTISIIETATNSVVETIDVGATNSVFGIGLTPDDQSLYVVLFQTNELITIDLDNLNISDPIPTGLGPTAVTASSDGEKVYFSNHYGESIGVLETDNNTVIATIDIPGDGPLEILVSPDNSKIYVITVNGYLITIDAETNTIINEFTTGTVDDNATYVNIAMHPDGSKLYISDIVAQEVYVFDVVLNDVIETIQIGVNITGIDVSPNGQKIVILSNTADVIKVINAENYEIESTINGFEQPTLDGSFLTSASLPTTIKNLSNDSKLLSVFPNPAIEEINITLKNLPSSALNYVLRNNLGQIIVSGEINSTDTQIAIDGSSLHAGMYIISAYGKDWVASKKVTLVKN